LRLNKAKIIIIIKKALNQLRTYTYIKHIKISTITDSHLKYFKYIKIKNGLIHIFMLFVKFWEYVLWGSINHYL